MDGHYSSANLMYCVKETDGAVGDYYVIGIAGTDEISSYDWFTEDMEVNEPPVAWPAGGHISKGSAQGFTNLQALVDPATKRTLDQFVQSLPSPSHLLVAGHSLGGALTQVYASYLQHMYGSAHFAYGYTYAAPTAGDQAFAENLNTNLGARYQGHENNLDVVPRAWQNSTLEELCTIYNGQSICNNTFSGNALTNGVMQFLMGYSSTTAYTQPDNITYFDKPEQLGDKTCNEGIPLLAAGLQFDAVAKADMTAIVQYCNPSNKLTPDDVMGLVTYLSKMGTEHTSAYLDHFIPGTAIQRQVNIYVPGAKDPSQNATEGIATIKHFLTKIKDYYAGKTNPHTSCACNASAM